MTDDSNAAASAAAPNSLREDLEEAWDRLSTEAEEPEPEEEDIPGEDEFEDGSPAPGEPPAPEPRQPGPSHRAGPRIGTPPIIPPPPGSPWPWPAPLPAVPHAPAPSRGRPSAMDVIARFVEASRARGGRR